MTLVAKMRFWLICLQVW